MSSTDHNGILCSWEKEQQTLVTVFTLVGNGIFFNTNALFQVNAMTAS